MKSMIDLWRVLAKELAGWCYTSTTLDSKTVESRVRYEGLSFLTITLPSFGKDFELALEQGKLGDGAFLGFKRPRKHGPPLFLEGFLRQIFDSSSGVLLDEPSKDSILAVRQLTLLFAKILLPCSDARIKGAFENYIQIEQDLLDWEEDNTFDCSQFRRISQLLFADVFAKMDEVCYYGELYPKHGPGSTADRLSGNQKYDQLIWSDRLESAGLHYGDYVLPNWRYNNRQGSVKTLNPGNEIPVKVIFVPKTLKTPRIIAIEPTYMQYMQQAVLFELVELIEADVVPGNARNNISSYFLGFTDQNPNRILACQGSEMRESLATLDLSDASDRVSNSLVMDLVHGFPFLSEVVQVTRSTKASIPTLGLSLFGLRKFASMGSATCFPFEAMVFLTAIFSGIENMTGHRMDRETIMSYRGKVRVYGDDLIIPTDCVAAVLDSLARLGFKVNVNKSFWNGKFRESCGGDYYDGEWVTPIRWRRKFPQSRRDVSEVISLVETRNLFYLNGLWQTAGWLDDQIRKILPHFPIVEPTSPALGRTSVSFQYEAEKMDDYLHAPRVRAYKIRVKLPANQASGIGSLMKCLNPRRGLNPFEDVRHLERSGRPSDVGITLRWMQPF